MGVSAHRLAPAASAVLGAVLLLGVYLHASFARPGDADVMRYSSGIYDMDVSRVVADVTSDRRAYRASVHPLQKLLLSPLGRAANAALFGGADRLAAAKLMVALAMTLQALAVGWLAAQLAGGSLAAGACAALVSGLSFSSLLAATLPESAAFASLASTAPLVFGNARAGRRFGWGEAAAWAGLAVLGFGLTVTQIAFWAAALLVRVAEARWQLAPGRLALRVAAIAAAAALLVAAGAGLQARLFPRSPAFYQQDPLRTESAFLRTRELAAHPVRHTARLLRQVAIDAFAAPMPAYSDFLMRDYGLDYWSLSSEEAGLDHWTGAQRALAAALLLALLGALVGLRRADVRFAAPALGVASQLALHLFYGREYVLYAPHWHGVLVALLVAGAWRGYPRRRPLLAVAAAALALALWANGLAVLTRVHREVEAGLEAARRDERGALPPGS